MTPEPADIDAPPPTRGGFRFKPEINLTGILTLVTMIVSVVIWAISTSNHADQAARDLGTVQATTAAQMADLKNAIGGGLSDVRQQISTLPDQRAKLDTDERRLTDLETRFNTLTDRMSAAERTEIELRVTLDSYLRTTSNGAASSKH